MLFGVMGTSVSKDVYKALASYLRFLFEFSDCRVIRTHQENSAHRNILIDPGSLQGGDYGGICYTRTLLVIPRSRDCKLPFFKLRNVAPIAQRHRYSCSTEGAQDERANVDVAFHQCSFIHCNTPSGELIAISISEPFRPDV